MGLKSKEGENFQDSEGAVGLGAGVNFSRGVGLLDHGGKSKKNNSMYGSRIYFVSNDLFWSIF